MAVVSRVQSESKRVVCFGVFLSEINMASYYSQLYSSLDDDFFDLGVWEMDSENLVHVFKCDSCKTLKTGTRFQKSHRHNKYINSVQFLWLVLKGGTIRDNYYYYYLIVKSIINNKWWRRIYELINSIILWKTISCWHFHYKITKDGPYLDVISAWVSCAWKFYKVGYRVNIL